MDLAQRDRWHELWGTFSVKDHCRPGAFVAEVLLYDKLLIPVPPTATDGLGAGEAAAEWARWAPWDPGRQQQILEILGDRAETIPWTIERQGEWKSAMAAELSDARRNGYFLTGSVLQRFAPAMAKSVVAVSQYHSLAELKDAGIRRVQPEEKLPANALLAVLGHELLLPDDPQRDEFSVLRAAVNVARDPNYVARRRALYDWQQDFLASDQSTDATSIKAAVADMQKLVDQLKRATASQKGWKWSKRFFSFLGATSKGAALVFPPLAPFAAAADAVISLGQFVTEEGAGAARPDSAALPAASLILDARGKLGVE